MVPVCQAICWAVVTIQGQSLGLWLCGGNDASTAQLWGVRVAEQLLLGQERRVAPGVVEERDVRDQLGDVLCLQNLISGSP